MTEYFLALQESVVNIRENALKLSKENDLIVHDINDLRSIIDKVIDSSHKKYSEDPYFEAKRAERARIIDGVFNNLVQKKIIAHHNKLILMIGLILMLVLIQIMKKFLWK